MANREADFGSMFYKSIYAKILKASSAGYVSQHYDISFEYEADYKYLSELKKITMLPQFNQIQNENEIQTFINATNWVSRILLSDKEAAIESISSYELISKVQEGAYAANCYAHAVVLNDVLYLLGYKSRYIFCMPIDYHFTDNHVVNLIYSKQLKKWVLFDAAQNLYYTDENGVILNIQELRERLINDKPIDVCLLDVYWSNLSPKEKIMFQNKNLVYMLKNMYRFHCFKNPYMDRLASYREIVDYHLVPECYMKTPFTRIFYEKETATKHIEIYSSDEERFWVVPEEDV